MKAILRKERYEAAFAVGKAWAVGQLAKGGEEDLADMRYKIDEACIAYVAIQTGQLPSLFFESFEQHEENIDLGSGFQYGAEDVLGVEPMKTRRRRQ